MPSGLDGAGKSSICATLLKEPLDKISPTLGFAIKTIEHDGYKLNICTRQTLTGSGAVADVKQGMSEGRRH